MLNSSKTTSEPATVQKPVVKPAQPVLRKPESPRTTKPKNKKPTQILFKDWAMI